MAKTGNTSANKKTVSIKKSASRSSRSKNASTPVMQSFKKARNSKFLVFEFTRQTVYWLIIGAMVLSLAAWVLYLQLQITNIYQTIESNSNTADTYVPVKRVPPKQP